MNVVLAIEASTAQPSVAILRGTEVLDQSSWEASRGATQRMLEATNTLLLNQNMSLEDIGLYGIGLGPGGFTGLRIALSAVEALALPAQANVIGISSAEAVAFQVKREFPDSNRMLIVGDARRRRLWMGTFITSDATLTRDGDFRLIPIDDFPGEIASDDIIATPDWDRLESEIGQLIPPTAKLIDKACIPQAATIAQLAANRVEHGLPGEPLEPIYMHPPVFVEPKFTK